jgi:thioredoxin-like negative regulator of GroEL
LAKIIELSDEDFEDYLEAHERLVVEVWAPACGPCKLQKPVVARIANEQSESWSFARIDGHQARLFAERFLVRAVPSILVFIAGEVRQRLLGLHNDSEIRACLQSADSPAAEPQAEVPAR